MLVSAGDDERLTEQELLSTLFQLFVAGHDTTTSLIGNGVVTLLDHPDQWQLLCAEPERIPAAIEEILRYDTPALHATFRVATEPLWSSGAPTIPTGAGRWSARRRQSRPDGLSRARHDSTSRGAPPHLAFGHGIHLCLGAPLAGWRRG